MVGIWPPLWQAMFKSEFKPQNQNRSQDAENNENGNSNESSNEASNEKPKDEGIITTWLSGLLLGSAMVARGEIGLLIIEIGYNSTSYVTKEGFITGVWAILLNTIIGPVTVGVLVKFYGKRIGEGKWGLQAMAPPGS